MNSVTHVVLTGGVGSRLWPLSRKSRPKQYIPLFEGKSLFQLCVLRNNLICNDLLIVGNESNRDLSVQNLKEIHQDNFNEIVEVTPRNTSAAIAFAAFSLGNEAVMLVTPSDQVVTGEKEYERSILEAISLAKENYLVTFGIKPSRPETGYGYIEFQDNDVVSFREKPDKKKAEDYVKSGRYLWNSGMFCFKADIFLEELKMYEPEIYNFSKNAFENILENKLNLEDSNLIPSKSVDYAVMERSKKIKVVSADFGWSDLGSFDSLWEYFDAHDDGPTRQNLVLGTNKHVEFLGVDNIVFVETDDAILILPRSMSQDVKNVYERLEREKPELLK
ncbi:mannose-1-phosphate guanylyltransferase [Rhizosphaericola mali]|uniref:Mannose-1-phosphate guanylyltransferase n=1 Tax=Rhizosphaericola mali TaxID=2545455 RepID=A0A5P2G8Y0_9BACT|nr:sugar phosphate nucleotidyltransferase [Rhizosphaericola mali]QES87981.1 mannose-1-phosphate guanylyltransferase [Rhizosphaericola mali]